MGSFLNLCIDRLPRGQSLISPPSRCQGCERRLGLLELVPLASYLWLGGKCRSCGMPIPRRVLVVEALSGAACGLLWWLLGPGPKLVVAGLYAFFFLLVAAIDLEHHRILNRVVYPALAAAPLAALAYGLSPPEILLGGLVSSGFMMVVYLLARGGVGAGDVKLAAVLGLITGFPEALVTLVAAALIGGVIAAALLATGRKGRKDAIAYAPILLAGATVALFWGGPIMVWYGGLLGV